MSCYMYARRGELPGASLHSHATNKMPLSSRNACPPLLTDVTAEASDSAAYSRQLVMQHGPLMGLGDLSETICRNLKTDGETYRPDSVLIANGANTGLTLPAECRWNRATAPTSMAAIQILRDPVLAFFRRLRMRTGCAWTD